MMQYLCDYFKLKYLWGYAAATVTGATMHGVAAVYPQSTLKGTPACSSHSGTVLYETYLASQEESGCVLKMLIVLSFLVIQRLGGGSISNHEWACTLNRKI